MSATLQKVISFPGVLKSVRNILNEYELNSGDETDVLTNAMRRLCIKTMKQKEETRGRKSLSLKTQNLIWNFGIQKVLCPQ